MHAPIIILSSFEFPVAIGACRVPTCTPYSARSGTFRPSITAPGLFSHAPMDRSSSTDARRQPLSPHGSVAVRPSLASARKMTMSGDMSLVLDVVNSVLGRESRAEWEEECLNLEVCNFQTWKRACGIWKQTGWVSKRIALAATCQAEAERAQRYAPQQSQSIAAPTMNMSLEQPLIVEAALVEEVAEESYACDT